MELGPIQKEWIKSLREHPERQLHSKLGERDDENKYYACCLGEYSLVCKSHGLGEAFWNQKGKIQDGDDDEHLVNSYKTLGLYTPDGELINNIIEIEGCTYNSLAEMNDGSMTWTEIADYVQANPDNVFTKSL